MHEDSRKAWEAREETERQPRPVPSIDDVTQRGEETMPNPSTIASEMEVQYKLHESLSRDPRLGKTTREGHLRAARRLAEELGIDGPPDINGRPAQQERYLTSDELEAERDRLLARIAEIDAEFEDRAEQRLSTQGR